MNFLIIAALALIALIIIALFFTGGITKIFGKKAAVAKASQQEIALAEANCKFWCSTGVKSSFESPPFSAEIIAAGYKHCGNFPDFGGSPTSLRADAWVEYCGECTGELSQAAITAKKAPCYSRKSKTDCSDGCTWEAKK